MSRWETIISIWNGTKTLAIGLSVPMWIEEYGNFIEGLF